MNAIIVTGGKQYTVAEGDVIYIEKLDQEAGDTVKFDRVLAILDRRTGKRTLQRIIREDDWNGYPEWARRFCKLRFDAEGLPYQDAPRPFPHPPATQPYFSQLVRGAFSSNAPQ